jgi:general secretion pathway protein D
VRSLLLLLLAFSCSVFAEPFPAMPSLPALPPLPAALAAGPLPLTPGAAMAATSPLRMGSAKKVDLRFVNVAQVVDLIYAEMLQTAYVIEPDVLADTRVVSFRFDRTKGDIRGGLSNFLDSLGFGVTTKEGTDYVFKRKEQKESEQRAPDREVFVYSPKYRSADYLSRLVQPLFSGQFTTNRAVPASAASHGKGDPPPSSAAALVDQSSDAMVFLGLPKEIEMLKQVLPQVDIKQGEVAIRAWVYEVSTGNDKSSGFQLAASILGGHLGISLGAGTIDDTANALRLHTGFLDAAIAALDSDSRFKVVTSPNLRVASGKHGRLNVGQSVPVIGAVSYPSAAGAPVQSVAYEDAGVIFDVLPVVKGEVTDADVTVEISDFVKTSTGVNNSPTKNTRKFETSMQLADGEVIVTGGLSQSKNSRVRSGVSFLPAFMDGQTWDDSKSDIVLVLQITKT